MDSIYYLLAFRGTHVLSGHLAEAYFNMIVVDEHPLDVLIRLKAKLQGPHASLALVNWSLIENLPVQEIKEYAQKINSGVPKYLQ